jgi:hypothetical protein
MTPQPRTPLSLGLLVFGLLSAIAISVAIWKPLPTSEASQSSDAKKGLLQNHEVYEHPALRAYAKALADQGDAEERALRQALGDLQTRGATQQQKRRLVLRSALASLRAEAPHMRSLPVRGYDAIMNGVADGLTQLQDTGSHWCRATTLATLTRKNEGVLLSTIIDDMAQSDAAYDWALSWVTDILELGSQARARPVRHGPRTVADEAVVQDFGRQIGLERWEVALSIAAFAQAEGRSYRAMKQALAAIDVCELGQTLEALSDRAPEAVRGRVMAELVPEIFYGNTPYVLYLLQGYFFIG